MRKGLSSMYLLEDPYLASKKYEFNYPKKSLIKLLLPFYPPCLDYLQERPKHGLDRHFIHKSVGKCDIIMPNCRRISYFCDLSVVHLLLHNCIMFSVTSTTILCHPTIRLGDPTSLPTFTIYYITGIFNFNYS